MKVDTTAVNRRSIALLKPHGQLHHRGRSVAPKGTKVPATFEATSPYQMFCWNIT